MKLRNTTLLVLVCILTAVFVTSDTSSRGGPPSPVKKISDISWGRFCTWSAGLRGGPNEYCEDDLFKRVYADHIRRTHKDLSKDWTLYFGAAASSDIIENIPPFDDVISTDPSIVNAWPLEQNWAYKKFAVIREGASVGGKSIVENYKRRDYTYSVSLNCLSPGTRIQTKNDLFYLENSNHGFGYIAYQDTDDNSVVVGDFADSEVPQSFLLGSLGENWVLLFDTMDENIRSYEAQIPILISFSHEPIIRCDKDHIRFQFLNLESSEELTVFISMPYGVDIADNAPIPPSGWTGGLPAEVIERARLVNMMANNWPVEVDETYSFSQSGGTTPERVVIENSFSFDNMGSEWGVTPSSYAVFPPLLSLADMKGLDVDILGDVVDTGIPTKIGPLMIIYGDNESSYELPGAPKHDIHFVGTHLETEWKQKADRMVNGTIVSTDRYRLDADGTMNTSALSAANNTGEFATLSLTKGWTRAHYIDWMQQMIDGHIFSSTLGEWRYYEHDLSPPPAEGDWPAFWAFDGDPVSTDVPWDIDCFAGIALEFIYEYGLWSGNWAGLNADHWDTGDVNITEIFYALELFHDWAYMAGSLNTYGGGSEMDMFGAQLEGYYTYAKIAEALGKADEAAWGRYLAAKAQIPFAMRWASKDYIAQYYFTDPGGYTQIISGFGEAEPSGPLTDTWNAVFLLEDWSDWTISGERIELLGFDALRVIAGDYFKDMLIQFDNEFDNIVGSTGEIMYGSFWEDKIYAFYTWRDVEPGRWSREELKHMIDLSCTNYSSTMWCQFKGPQHYYGLFFSDDGDWYNGSTGSWNDPPYSTKAQIFSLLPAMMETYYVPVRVGSWAPAVLEEASYNWETNTFTAHFSRPDNLPVESPSPVVRLQVDTEPIQITGDVAISGNPYDPVWKVAEIPLAGGMSEWTISATIPAVVYAEWDFTNAESNLVRDPGFEECGTGNLNNPLPNMEMGWWIWPPIDDLYDLKEFSSEDQSACMYIYDDSTYACVIQYIWIGPDDPAELPHHVNIEFDYRFDPELPEIVEEYQLRVAVLIHPRELGDRPSDPVEYILNPRILCAEQACIDEWQHFDSGLITVEPSEDIPHPAIVDIRFFVGDYADNPIWTADKAHGVCIDNVIITCPELDMGSDGVPSLTSPKPASNMPLPALSNFVSYPNPFNPSVQIRFEMGQRNHALLNIYDVNGRLVRTLVNGTLPAGQHTFAWDGRNNRGAQTSSGLYFYRLQVADMEEKGKLILLR